MSKGITDTLNTIDAVISSWQDWEAEDAKPDPRASELREQFDCLRPVFSHAPAMHGMLQAAVDRWGEVVTSDTPINGTDAVDWLASFITAASPLMTAVGGGTAPSGANALLRDCLGAMQAMRHQIEQMRGMFDDADGTIQEACDAHEETSAAVEDWLDGIPNPVGATVGTNRYLVEWSMDIWADTARQAAEKALRVQRDPASSATVFRVMDEEGVRVSVDLDEPGPQNHKLAKSPAPG